MDDGEPTPVDAFELVGNEIRAEIIRTLGEARVRERARPVLSFSELRSRIDFDLRSSKFTYHLQKLVGHYVEKVDGGYRMRPEGRTLYRTIRAGSFMRRAEPAEQAVNTDCYYCGGTVVATFGGGLVTVRCRECEHVYDNITAPPGVNDGERWDLDAVERYNHWMHLSFARGGCRFCGNDLGTEFLTPEEVPYPSPPDHEVSVYRSCDGCGSQMFLSVGEVALADAEVVAFCYDHGVDVLSTPFWELEFAATERFVTVRSRDPWEVALDVTFGDDTLRLVFDENLSVVERTRT